MFLVPNFEFGGAQEIALDDDKLHIIDTDDMVCELVEDRELIEYLYKNYDLYLYDDELYNIYHMSNYWRISRLVLDKASLGKQLGVNAKVVNDKLIIQYKNKYCVTNLPESVSDLNLDCSIVLIYKFKGSIIIEMELYDRIFDGVYSALVVLNDSAWYIVDMSNMTLEEAVEHEYPTLNCLQLNGSDSGMLSPIECKSEEEARKKMNRFTILG